MMARRRQPVDGRSAGSRHVCPNRSRVRRRYWCDERASGPRRGPRLGLDRHRVAGRRVRDDGHPAAHCEGVHGVARHVRRAEALPFDDRHGASSLRCRDVPLLVYPLPPIVDTLREYTYPHLAEIANTWGHTFPSTLAELLARCHREGQTRPTPLLLHYDEGDWNVLHQDLYGAVHFPLQMAVALTAPGTDYDGGEMLFVEQRPRPSHAAPHSCHRSATPSSSRPTGDRSPGPAALTRRPCATG